MLNKNSFITELNKTEFKYARNVLTLNEKIVLTKKLQRMNHEHRYPEITELTEGEYLYCKWLLETEKSLPVDLAINPTSQYMTCRTESPDKWYAYCEYLKNNPVLCENCGKEISSQSHEVWSYETRGGDTCVKKLVNLHRLCVSCHALCHTYKLSWYLKTGKNIVPDYRIRDTTHKISAEVYNYQRRELSKLQSILNIYEWTTLHALKFCISNYYRNNFKKFELDITYFYNTFEEVINND